jgi:hypothetical protein
MGKRKPAKRTKTIFSAGVANCTTGSLVERELMKRPIVTARRIVRQFIARKIKKGPTAGLKLHILKVIRNMLESLDGNDRKEKRKEANQ